MKALLSILMFVGMTVISQAQESPVSWRHHVKKTGPTTYEVRFSAIIQQGWHIHAQTQPKDAIAIPTSIQFITNPLVKLNGKLMEKGKLEKAVDPILEIEQYQYSTKVDFIQTVELKQNVKTSLKGTIHYMACSGEQCLPERQVPFNISIANYAQDQN